MALAVGDLEFRPLGPRSGVYAEPAVVERAAWELADTPKMIAAAEKLYGPYRWGRYDMLVLPPSFPFGGMENPRLTFATPTILAGDRSLVSLVAHELAHSWSGNLVTNATWNDFWLNEGFTTYFERRIMEALYGRDYAEMLAAARRGRSSRTPSSELGPDSPDTHLAPRPRRPRSRRRDERRRLREGRALPAHARGGGRAASASTRFLRTYFDRYAFQSMDTDALPRLPDSRTSSPAAPALTQELQVEQWVYGPGVPANAPQPQLRRLRQGRGAGQRLRGRHAGRRSRPQGWTTHTGCTSSATSPSRSRPSAWPTSTRLQAHRQRQLRDPLRLAAARHRQQLRAGLPGARAFLTGQGPPQVPAAALHELAKTPAGAELALRIYEKARPGYHSVSRQTIDEILDWQGVRVTAQRPRVALSPTRKKIIEITVLTRTPAPNSM